MDQRNEYLNAAETFYLRAKILPWIFFFWASTGLDDLVVQKILALANFITIWASFHFAEGDCCLIPGLKAIHIITITLPQNQGTWNVLPQFWVEVECFFKKIKIFQNLSTFAMKVSKAMNLVGGWWKSSPKPIISNTVMFVKCSQSDFSLQRALCRFIWDWGASKSKLRFGWKWSCVQKRGAL